MARNRAIGRAQFRQRKFTMVPLTGIWQQHIGTPELTGSWIIWGDSFQGKTTYALEMAKELSKHGPVDFNCLEEGESYSNQLKWEKAGIFDLPTDRKIQLLHKMQLNELSQRLNKRRSAKFVFINTIQYLMYLKFAQYQKFIEQYPDKIFIWIAKGDNKLPLGKVANDVRFDSHVKIRVEGYRAFAQSRYGGTSPYDIWPEKASQYWGA